MTRHRSIALGFLALIFVGAILLAAPFSRVQGTWGSALPAFFTSCSAVCVTGLSIVDIAGEYTRAGQVVLMALVELGCLGLMTCGTFFLVAIGRRLSLSREFSLMNAYGVEQIQGLRGLIFWIVGCTFVIEFLGAAVVYCRLHDWYQAIFYSVMSFCNAGFSLRPDSIAAFAADPTLVLTLAMETILGGIGFLVLYNLCTFKFLRRRSGGKGRLSLHASVVLRYTFYLLVITFVLFLIVEWQNALRDFGGVQKLWVAFYQAVTPRTCGFCIVPTEALHPLTRHFYKILMFIGGAPGSAAAGIKVTTLAVLLYTLRALCRNETETVVSRRAVPTDVVRESIVIMMALLACVCVIFGALLVTEHLAGIAESDLLFEAISAVTTTGLSVGGTTASLSTAGKLVIMVAMFLGRLGALSVVLMIGDREASSHVRYPTEELVVG